MLPLNCSRRRKLAIWTNDAEEIYDAVIGKGEAVNLKDLQVEWAEAVSDMEIAQAQLVDVRDKIKKIQESLEEAYDSAEDACRADVSSIVDSF